MNFPFHVRRTTNVRTPEEQDIIKSLNEIRESMACVYDRLDYSSDELITDSLNYELMALKSRHRFYIEKAKELRVSASAYRNKEV